MDKISGKCQKQKKLTERNKKMKISKKSTVAKKYSASEKITKQASAWCACYAHQADALDAFVENYLNSDKLDPVIFNIKMGKGCASLPSSMPVSHDPRDGYLSVREAIRYFIHTTIQSWNRTQAVHAELDLVRDIVYIRRVDYADFMNKTALKKARGMK